VTTSTIVNRVLNTEFEISSKEFFAIFPDGRNYLKDILTAKKLPAVEAAYSSLASGVPNNLHYVLHYKENGGRERVEKLTSLEIDVLRVIDPLINDKFQIEAVLD
jgi:hypothetical protein